MLIKISKDQVQNLIKKGYLKNVNGKYPELHITSKQKKGKRKNYFVPDYLKNKI